MKRLPLAIAVLGPLFVALLWAAALAYAAVSEREVTYRYIADALSPRSEPESLVTWRDPALPLARPVTPADQDRVGLAMTDAWQALAVAQSSGRTDILTDTFSGVALDRALLSVVDAQSHGGRMAVLSQSARPVFFHLDGSVLQAEVEMLVARYAVSEAGLQHHEVTRDTGVLTLMNEPTGWRVFSYERSGGRPIAGTAPDWTPESLAGINYYPAATPWRSFWPEFDEGVIAEDFARIRALNANAVRIFLTQDDFTASDTRDMALEKLSRLLMLANDAGLRVVPTLFDLRGGYGPGAWATDAAYLGAVLPVLAGAPSVSFVDIKNEPDLDFDAHGEAEVEAWLETMIEVSRDIAPGLALSVGWSSAGAASRFADRLDVVSYHDYAPLEGAEARLSDVRQASAGRPVIVTEIGASSYRIALGFPGSPEAQAERLGARLDALKDADGVFVWTLHDFAEVDGTVVGRSPWVKRLQSSFGLIATDGSMKPAAATVRKAFAPPP